MWLDLVAIGMLILGGYALIAGKFTLTKTRVVRGTAARLLGVIALLPLPITFGVSFAIGFYYASRGQAFRADEWRLTLSLIAGGLVLGCLAAVYLIGWPLAESPDADRRGDRRRGDRGRADDRYEDDRDDDDDRDWRDERRRPRREREPEEMVAAQPPPLPVPPARAPVVPPVPAAPANLRFRCSRCSTVIQISSAFAGQKVRCPQCQAILIAPPAPPPPVAAPALAQHITERPPAERVAAPPAPPRLDRAADDRHDPDERDGRDRDDRAGGERRRRGAALSVRQPSSIPAGVIVTLVIVGVVAAGAIVGVILWKFTGLAPAPVPMPGPIANPGGNPGGNRGANPGGIPEVKPGGVRGGNNARVIGKNENEPGVLPPFGLPPLPDPLDIKPAPIQAETSVKMPAPIGSVRVGGGGRFLVLHFPQIRQIGIFDVNEAKVTRYISPAEPDIRFAAGMTKLVVFSPQMRDIRRFNLLDGARDLDAVLILPPGKIESFCMGHASHGPLLVSVAGHGAKLYDIERFREIPLPEAKEPRHTHRLDGGNYWAGATGRVFGHTGNYGMPNGVNTVVFTDGGPQKFGQHKGTWFVMPGPDDRHVYAGGYGVVSDRVTPVTNVPFSMGEGEGFASHLYLPAHHGPYYLHAQTIEDVGGRGLGQPVGTVSVFVLGDKEPIATYRNTAVCRYGWEGLRGLGIEHSLHLIPRAKLLIIVPGSRDELRLYPADLEAALDNSGRDFLVFTSTPPAGFQRGQAFTYQAKVHARKKPVTFRLDSAPKGMTVDAKGLIRWTPPANFAAARVDVILAARDAGGQEGFHNLALTAR